MQNELIILQQLSNRYGSDSRYVLAGGGNTSFKNDANLYVKGSGTALATIKAADFVKMERSRLSAMWERQYSEDEKEREKEVLADMMAARSAGETRRPSVETLLHDLFPQRYVLHVHPTSINGMTCGKQGKQIAAVLFPDAVWVDACKPGYILASLCRDALNDYRNAHDGKTADLLFLQNHGVFFAADSVPAIDALVSRVMDTVDAYRKTAVQNRLVILRDALRDACGVSFAELVSDPAIASFDPSYNSPTPDHIVYCKANYLTVDLYTSREETAEAVKQFADRNGYTPRIVCVKGQGAAVVLADNEKQLDTQKQIFADQVAVYHASACFGGYYEMPSPLVDFIVNWEVESYRAKVQG